MEFLRGTPDVLILKALVWGPQHGYSIAGLIRRQSDDARVLEEGTLYPALWRLESKKLVVAEWGLSEDNRKTKFYSLTLRGRRHLRDSTKTWEAYAQAISKVLSTVQPREEATSARSACGAATTGFSARSCRRRQGGAALPNRIDDR